MSSAEVGERDAADPLGDRRRVVGVDVADGDDAAPGDDGVDAVDVRLPHAAGADHSDADGHCRASQRSAETERREVLAGLDGDGQGLVLGAAVHVLLADDVELLVEVGERLDEVVHVGQAGGRRDRARRRARP